MCGILGVAFKNTKAVDELFFGGMHLGHRGKSSFGMSTYGNGKFMRRAKMGEIAARSLPISFGKLVGTSGIAQTRYSTTGLTDEKNIQPVSRKRFHLVHNGNVVNPKNLANGMFIESHSDTRIIANHISCLLGSGSMSFEDAIISTVKKLRGSFNLIFLANDRLYVVKDRFGFHPLQIGETDDGYVVASESCALDHLNARFIRDVQPGEFLIIDHKSIEEHIWTDASELLFDIFEFIYFLRPDSFAHGVEAGLARRMMGKMLAKLFSVDADLVISIPDSGNEAAWGYYEEIKNACPGIIFDPWAQFRPHTVSRTFIDNEQKRRLKSLKQKFNPRPLHLRGKRTLVVDDSLIRGNTSKRFVEILYDAGVKSIDLMIASPPYVYPDHYGIDTGRKGDRLIINDFNNDPALLAKHLGVNSVNYLPLEYTIQAVLEAQRHIHERVPGHQNQLNASSFYTGPFSGIYPDGKGDYA